MNDEVLEFRRVYDEYFKKFNDSFPTYCVRHLSYKKITELMQKCIDENKPTDLCNKKDVDY